MRATWPNERVNEIMGFSSTEAARDWVAKATPVWIESRLKIVQNSAGRAGRVSHRRLAQLPLRVMPDPIGPSV